MEKLMHVVRLRLTDEMREEIRRFMAADDRRVFDEAVRHLLREGLKTKRSEPRNGLGVEVQDAACSAKCKPPARITESWSGVERRRQA